MLKLSFSAANSESDYKDSGFKFSMQAENKEEQAIAERLVNALIGKIEKIVIEIKPPNYDNEE